MSCPNPENIEIEKDLLGGRAKVTLRHCEPGGFVEMFATFSTRQNGASVKVQGLMRIQGQRGVGWRTPEAVFHDDGRITKCGSSGETVRVELAKHQKKAYHEFQLVCSS